MKKFFALLLSIMLLSTAALAEVKIGQVEYAAHGTSCFAVLTVAMDGDTIVAAHIDEFQFMDAATAEGVPNSDASFGQNYPEGKVSGRGSGAALYQFDYSISLVFCWQKEFAGRLPHTDACKS